MSLRDLVRAGRPIDEIASHLDALAADTRQEEVQAVGGADQRSLFDAVAASPALDLEFFVPKSTPDLGEVIHHGRNSLPLFKRFEKHFCRPAGDGGRLFGFNEGPSRPLIGPGYFVAHSTDPGDARGAIVVDYFQVPDTGVSSGWPKVVPNNRGLQVLVYNHTRDYMRRVSNHVSIGQAHKNEKNIIGTFILCREDA